MGTAPASQNRVLVVDDDARQVGEYVRCLSDDFEPDAATETLSDLEKAGGPDEYLIPLERARQMLVARSVPAPPRP